MWSMSISTVPTPTFSHSPNSIFTAANPNLNPNPKQANPNLYRASAAAARFRGGGGGRQRRRLEDDYRNITLSFDDDKEEEEEEEEETEHSGQQVVAYESSSDRTVEIEREIVSRDEAGGRKLSGSDVIWALQRATANKYSKTTKSRRSSSNSDNKIRIEESGEDEDYSNAVPLCINEDWATRLDDLDNRLQSLFTSLDLDSSFEMMIHNSGLYNYVIQSPLLV